MAPATLREAIAEAQRFVKLAKLVQFTSTKAMDGKTYEYVVTGPQPAAAKRASLDLTKALARMRKP
jgi:hypothetical protein